LLLVQLEYYKSKRNHCACDEGQAAQKDQKLGVDPLVIDWLLLQLGDQVLKAGQFLAIGVEGFLDLVFDIFMVLLGLLLQLLLLLLVVVYKHSEGLRGLLLLHLGQMFLDLLALLAVGVPADLEPVGSELGEEASADL